VKGKRKISLFSLKKKGVPKFVHQKKQKVKEEGNQFEQKKLKILVRKSG